MPSVLEMYEKSSRIPFVGHKLFSLGFALKAPYFLSVQPDIVDLRPHYCEVRLPNWWAVHNHIGTVHAIAACNGLEAAMGALAEATTPPGKRWIPKGMQVSYTAKATSGLTCVAETDPADWDAAGDVPVRVTATRDDGTVVVQGTIDIWVTDKRA